MAQLKWEPIEAPRMDISGLAQATSGFTNAFDRLGQTLINKEASLRDEATEAARAQALMASTPEQIAALRAQGLNGLDRRVNQAAYAETLGQVENDITKRALTQEQLTAARDPRVNAGVLMELALARESGDPARLAAAQAAARESGTALGMSALSDGVSWNDTRVDNIRGDKTLDETIAARLQNDAIQRQTLALQRRAQTFREQESAGTTGGFQLGRDAAKATLGMPTPAAREAFINSEGFARIKNSRQQQEALAGFDGVATAYATPTAAQAQAAGLPAFLTQLDTIAASAGSQAASVPTFIGKKNPAYDVLRREAADPKKYGADVVDRDTAVAAVDAKVNTMLPGFVTNNLVDSGASPGRIVAALDAQGTEPWYRALNPYSANGQGVRDLLGQVRDLEDKGGLTQINADIAAYQAPFLAAQERVNQLKELAAVELRNTDAISPETKAAAKKVEAELVQARKAFEKKMAGIGK